MDTDKYKFGFVFFFPNLCLFTILLSFSFNVSAQSLKTAVLRTDENSHPFYQKFRRELAKQNSPRLIDDDLSAAAKRALDYPNLFNLSLEEAKNLGASIDCDFFFVVKAETLRRSSFKKDVYFESQAIVFLVSARTGRLIAWENPSFEGDAPEVAEKLLLANAEKIAARFVAKLETAFAAEREARAAPHKSSPYLEISDGENAEKQNIRIPLPYKRLRPAYTEAAERASAVAAVDVSVDLNEAGKVENVEIARWAGFGLDEETVATVKKMQFRPALKNGVATPARFVLRYNFRRLQE